MDKKIEERRSKGLYWDRAWKCVEGCTKCSPGCDNCWSESETVMRSNHPNTKIKDRALIVTAKGGQDGEPVPQGCFTGNITMRHDNLDLPLRVKKPTTFSIWNDLFHEDVSDEFIIGAHIMMNLCQQHTFLLLTKRIERMADFYQRITCDDIYNHWFTFSGAPEELVDWPCLPNVYHGTTVCNQDEADRKIPLLSQVPGKTFLSIEPMLGPINLNRIYFNGVVDQVLLGGESGKNARPMHPEWVRTIRDQCAAAGVAFDLKQWGEWVPAGMVEDETKYTIEILDGTIMVRIGKKKAGRTLDGKIHADLVWDKICE